ncbi:hypothetical protein AMTR_s00038p00062640 [Amborella trichopoda]|uniref:Uncharacterized protein n=1 Tax=Amborella trichopoda TaxID=13333 RepID=U5CX80_AMBTC|nr:hypothetical protein AMTR_s00038p00062640 [Amborella trichopoda]
MRSPTPTALAPITISNHSLKGEISNKDALLYSLEVEIATRSMTNERLEEELKKVSKNLKRVCKSVVAFEDSSSSASD